MQGVNIKYISETWWKNIEDLKTSDGFVEIFSLHTFSGIICRETSAFQYKIIVLIHPE